MGRALGLVLGFAPRRMLLGCAKSLLQTGLWPKSLGGGQASGLGLSSQYLSVLLFMWVRPQQGPPSIETLQSMPVRPQSVAPVPAGQALEPAATPVWSRVPAQTPFRTVPTLSLRGLVFIVTLADDAGARQSLENGPLQYSFGRVGARKRAHRRMPFWRRRGSRIDWDSGDHSRSDLTSLLQRSSTRLHLETSSPDLGCRVTLEGRQWIPPHACSLMA